MADEIPDFIIDAVIEFAIIGYAKENGLETIPGKLWPEKPDWLPHLNALIRTGDKKELARLAVITAEGNQTSLDNIERVFGAGSIDMIRDRYGKVARKPDGSRADAGTAIRSAIDQISREHTRSETNIWKTLRRLWTKLIKRRAGRHM